MCAQLKTFFITKPELMREHLEKTYQRFASNSQVEQGTVAEDVSDDDGRGSGTATATTTYGQGSGTHQSAVTAVIDRVTVPL